MTVLNGSRPSGYKVKCQGEMYRSGRDSCGTLDLTQDEYMRQLSRADEGWVCPRCRGNAWIIEPEDYEDTEFMEAH